MDEVNQVDLHLVALKKSSTDINAKVHEIIDSIKKIEEGYGTSVTKLEESINLSTGFSEGRRQAVVSEKEHSSVVQKNYGNIQEIYDNTEHLNSIVNKFKTGSAREDKSRE